MVVLTGSFQEYVYQYHCITTDCLAPCTMQGLENYLKFIYWGAAILRNISSKNVYCLGFTAISEKYFLYILCLVFVSLYYTAVCTIIFHILTTPNIADIWSWHSNLAQLTLNNHHRHIARISLEFVLRKPGESPPVDLNEVGNHSLNVFSAMS